LQSEKPSGACTTFLSALDEELAQPAEQDLQGRRMRQVWVLGVGGRFMPFTECVC